MLPCSASQSVCRICAAAHRCEGPPLLRQVRPYTVRRGDTLASIAEKREVPLDQLLKLNHNTSPDALQEGQTLLLPSGKLSSRDKEILEGIGPWTYRTYPVRSGEHLEVGPFEDAVHDTAHAGR